MLPQPDLFLHHRRDLSANCIHFLLAAIGFHDGQRGGRALFMAQINRLLQLCEFCVEMDLQRSQPFLLPRVIDGQIFNLAEAGRRVLNGCIVGTEGSFRPQ